MLDKIPQAHPFKCTCITEPRRKVKSLGAKSEDIRVISKHYSYSCLGGVAKKRNVEPLGGQETRLWAWERWGIGNEIPHVESRPSKHFSLSNRLA